MKMDRIYLIQDGINNDYYDAATFKEVKEAVKEIILDEEDEGYHPEATSVVVYKKYAEIEMIPIDSKENHTKEEWDKITKGNSDEFEEIVKHRFKKIKDTIDLTKEEFSTLMYSSFKEGFDAATTALINANNLIQKK